MAEPLTELPVLQCSLDAAGMRAQRERYARVVRRRSRARGGRRAS